MTHQNLRRVRVAAVIAAAMLLSACSTSSPSASTSTGGSSAATGATEIPGGPTESIPTASSPKIPVSRQEAQDAVVHYLQATIDALPKGTTLDGSRYIVGDGTAYCEDNPSGDGAPVHVEDWRDMSLPARNGFQRDYQSNWRYLEAMGVAGH